jgi:hypothetical protein
MLDLLDVDSRPCHARPRPPRIRQVTALLEQAAREFTAAEAQAREDDTTSPALLVARRAALYTAAIAFARGWTPS